MDRGRFSFMGAQGGPLWRAITYHLPPPTSQPHSPPATTAQPGSPSASSSQQRPAAPAEPSAAAGLLPLPDISIPCPPPQPSTGSVFVQNGSGQVTSRQMPFFHYLRQLLATHKLQVTPEAAQQLPFNFWGGLVGYLGYELKAECGGVRAHAARTPDAGLLFADRLLAVDHVNGDVYLLAVYDQRPADQQGRADSSLSPLGEDEPGLQGVGGGQGIACSSGALQRKGSGLQGVTAVHGMQQGGTAARGIQQSGTPVQVATAWLDQMQQRLSLLGSAGLATAPSGTEPRGQQATGVSGPVSAGNRQQVATGGAPNHAVEAAPDRTLRLRHPKQRYLDNIAACISALHSGESYEVCLTTALVRRGAPPPHELYKALRSLNPAPYGAWINLGSAGPTLCCSSPERFLRGDRGGVLEARPIKGTAARHLTDTRADAAAAHELSCSEKDRAENLMIVDLLRNDLGAVCEVGSVHVPGLMEIESYATVHQMVSTVRGLRRRDATLVDALQAAFPAGSMTGAPKVRTMAIIDTLEGCARGVYSGSIGFISLNDCFDLNVVIRTAVVDSGARLQGTAVVDSRARLQRPGNRLWAGTADDAGAQAVDSRAQLQGPGSTLGAGTGDAQGCACGGGDSMAMGGGHGHDCGVPLEVDQGSQGRGAPWQGLGGSLGGSVAVGSERQGEGAGHGLQPLGGRGPSCPGLDEALLTIGAGGAIVVQSELESEFAEMRLKARALLAALGRCDGGAGPAVLDDTQPWGGA